MVELYLHSLKHLHGVVLTTVPFTFTLHVAWYYLLFTTGLVMAETCTFPGTTHMKPKALLHNRVFRSHKYLN
jgi:hypothetical protein